MTDGTGKGGAVCQPAATRRTSDRMHASTETQPSEGLKRRAAALTVDRMLSMIGHELNQPLNVISMASFNGVRMASSSTTTAADFERRFQVIQDETRRAGALVHTAMRLAASATSSRPVDYGPCPVALLHEVVMPRLKRRRISLSVRPTMATNAFATDRWLVIFVMLCGLERLEEDRATKIDDDEAMAECRCDFREGTGELTFGLRSSALVGRPVGNPNSPFTALLDALAAACGGRVVDEPGRWLASLPVEALS